MSTAEEGGAAANATTSSYGGGGAGGKFPKRPSRRQAKPYERPPPAVRGNNTNSNNSSSWLTKLVVEPASKLITYGADRFFGSVFRRSLPPPPIPQQPESNAQESDKDQETGLNSKGGGHEPENGQCSQPINSSSSNGVTELENLLKQKTFSRSEIAHLAELLQSRAAEVSPGDGSRINVVPAVDSGRQNQFASCISEGNRNDGNKSSPVMFTPIQNSHVLENDMASPAELAKAYMGRRPSQVSPSDLGMRNQLGKESIGFVADTLVASKSPFTSLATRTSDSRAAADNGFITPRPRGRSAIYTMARTPYSRVHPTSALKGSGINRSGYAGPSTSSSNFSPLNNDGNFDSQTGTLKRRSSVLDDEIGSVGPMRRIRQKPNLLASRFHHTAHGVGVGSHAKQKPQLNREERNKGLKNSGENENESVPSTSYAHVPSQSKEVAAKILQQLEKISPKEKSSESKLGAMQEKSPLKPMSSRLSGQVLQSMDDAGSSKLLLNFHDDLKSGNKNNVVLPDVHESSPQNLGKAEGDNPNVSIVPSSRWNSALNNNSAVPLKASNTGLGTADIFVKQAASQPQKKKAFRMNAEEDALELDGVECNGLASKSFSENKGPFESLLTKPAGEPKTALQSGSISAAVTFGQGTSFFALPASEGTRAASQSQTFTSFGLQNKSNSLHVFGSSSKAADRFPSLPSDSAKRAESQPEISSSLANISKPVGASVATPEMETVKAADTNGTCDDVSSATLNGPPVSFPAVSPSDNHRISANSAPLSSSAPDITNFVSTSSAVTTGGSLSGWAAKSTSSSGPSPKLGSSLDPPSTVSAVPTANIFEKADQGAKIDINPSSASSATSHSNFAAATASSGNGIFKFGSSFGNSTGNSLQSSMFAGSSFGNSTGNSLQSSMFAGATKSPMFGANAVTQGKPVEPFSSASAPALNMNTGASLGTLASPSVTFGLSSSSTSSSDTTSVVPAGGPTSSLFKFGATPTAVSEGSAVSSSASTAPISFGLSSSSSSTSTVFSSSGPSMPVFTSGGTSISAFGGGTSGLFGSGGSSSASSTTTNIVSSSSAPTSNIFGSGFQSPKFPTFGSSFASASPSSGFSFSASTNATATMPFNSSTGTSSSPLFSFTGASAPALFSQHSPNPHPVFGNPPTGGGFAASPGNNDQMNAEDTMAEDPAPSSAPVVSPVFGQPSPSPSPFTFGSNAPTQNNPFMFNGQQSQSPLQNTSPFAASGSLEFSAGGGFSVGSTGVDKSGRKIVKINRSKNRKK